MPRIPLIGGAYQSRSIIANAQKCINLYPEVNTKDALAPVTHYQRPGLRPLATPTVAGPGRGVFRASNGNGFCVVGTKVFKIQPGWTLTLIGTLQSDRTNPVSFTDNGTTGLLVDGSNQGYTINIVNGAFAPLVDSTGTFVGADRKSTRLNS